MTFSWMLLRKREEHDFSQTPMGAAWELWIGSGKRWGILPKNMRPELGKFCWTRLGRVRILGGGDQGGYQSERGWKLGVGVGVGVRVAPDLDRLEIRTKLALKRNESVPRCNRIEVGLQSTWHSCRSVNTDLCR